jgi:pyruvate/2-oxoglutarate dehydrogenase complex dihydrolipoamide acyltransferase (E2) component
LSGDTQAAYLLVYSIGNSSCGKPLQDRIFATPIAKKIALKRGISQAQVKGTGPEGRIFREDVEKFKGTPSQRWPYGNSEVGYVNRHTSWTLIYSLSRPAEVAAVLVVVEGLLPLLLRRLPRRRKRNLRQVS